jgi:DNA-binding transcriptional regulator GbsR (MarR family)
MAREEPPNPEAALDGAVDPLVQDFVEHWGLMARSWGINSTMGELFALLFISGGDWTADQLREALQISRGNASMNLRELITWGVVHRVHHQGERREFYKAEGDVWTLFRRILAERKRRELDPTLDLLEHTASRLEKIPAFDPEQRDRVLSLLTFFRMMNGLATLLTSHDPDLLRDLFATLEVLTERTDTSEQ